MTSSPSSSPSLETGRRNPASFRAAIRRILAISALAGICLLDGRNNCLGAGDKKDELQSYGIDIIQAFDISDSADRGRIIQAALDGFIHQASYKASANGNCIIVLANDKGDAREVEIAGQSTACELINE